MLPDPRQVGEPQIDHLDLLVLDRLQEIFGCRTIRNHGFTPVTERDTLKIDSPFSRCQRLGTDFSPRSTFSAAVGPASIRHGRARIQARLCTLEPAASALVRRTYELQGVFDMPPGSGQFHLALFFTVGGGLGGFRN